MRLKNAKCGMDSHCRQLGKQRSSNDYALGSLESEKKCLILQNAQMVHLRLEVGLIIPSNYSQLYDEQMTEENNEALPPVALPSRFRNYHALRLS